MIVSALTTHYAWADFNGKVIAVTPVSNELLMRYQIALDGDLYCAMNQLRKQQEWRIKSGFEIDAEDLAA